jgi:hypothetical protein
MLTKIPRDLDLYPTVDQRQMKTINVKYSVIMGYWALRNNMQEYNERFDGRLGKKNSQVKK